MREPFQQNLKYLPPAAGEPALHRAARLGDHDEIEKLLSDGADVNAVFDLRLDPGGRHMWATPLMVASGSGYGATIDTMKLLMKLGADVKVNHGAGTVARFAAGGLGWNYLPGGDATRLKWALDQGIDPNEIDARGVTLLAEAANTGDHDRVIALLNAGANPDPPPSVRTPQPDSSDAWKVKWSFQIPLFCAAQSCGVETIRSLLRAKAHTSILDEEQRTALFYASTKENVVALLAAGFDLNARDVYGWSPLTSAVTDGDIERIQALLDAGANANETHDRGFTVFMTAAGAVERRAKVMHLLLQAGANPHAVTELGWNAFHAAIDVSAEANEEPSVRSTLELLARLGIDINHRDCDGVTPLGKARRCGTKIEIEVLEKLGAKE